MDCAVYVMTNEHHTVLYTAVTSDVRGVGEAWFKVTDQSGTIVLQVGQALSRPSFDVVVVGLEDDSATVTVDQQLYRLSIGQTLADALPVETP